MKGLSWGVQLSQLVGLAIAWQHVSEKVLQEAVKPNEPTLVAFVLPSLELSKVLEPEWLSLQNSGQPGSVVSFDCSADPRVCKSLDVTSYPAIRLYHADGRVDRYRGPRAASSIKAFLRRMQRPVVEVLSSQPDTAFLGSDDVVFVGRFLPDDADSFEERQYEEGFRALARKYRDRYTFAMAPAETKSSLSCRNNLSDSEHELTELWRVEIFESLMRICTRDLIVEITKENEGEIAEVAQTGKSLLHFFTATKEAKEKYRSELQQVAKANKEAIQFTIIDTNNYPDMPPAAGLDEGTKTGLSFEDTRSGNIYPYTGGETITESVVESFLDSIAKGKAEPWQQPMLQGYPDLSALLHDEL